MDALSLLSQVKAVFREGAEESFLDRAPELVSTMLDLLQHEDEAVQMSLLECLLQMYNVSGGERFLKSPSFDHIISTLKMSSKFLPERLLSNLDQVIALFESARTGVNTYVNQAEKARELATCHALDLSSSYFAKRGNDILVFSLVHESAGTMEGTPTQSKRSNAATTANSPSNRTSGSYCDIFIAGTESAANFRNRIIQIPHVVSCAILPTPDNINCAAMVVTVRAVGDSERQNLISVIIDNLPFGVSGNLEVTHNGEGPTNELTHGYLDSSPSRSRSPRNLVEKAANEATSSPVRAAAVAARAGLSPTSVLANKSSGFGALNGEVDLGSKNKIVNGTANREADMSDEAAPLTLNVGGAGGSTGIMATSVFMWNSSSMRQKMQLVRTEQAMEEDNRAAKLADEKKRRRELLEKQQQRKRENKISSIFSNLTSFSIW